MADRSVRAGCVELGRDGGKGHLYCTRYYIHHGEQRSELCKDIVVDEVCPCCGPKAHRSFWYMVWAVVRSEAFLFILHITALALGVIKEADNMRTEREGLHLIHSIIETLVSIILIIVRVTSGWTAFYHLKKAPKQLERLPGKDKDYKKHHVQGHSLRRWAFFLTGISFILLLFLIYTFMLFYYRSHLGWTILTNQFALILITMVSGLYTERIEQAECLIREDQHKAVLYEAVLLLQELRHATLQDSQDCLILVEQIDSFCRALGDTKFFDQPSHIKLHSNKEQTLTDQDLKQNGMAHSLV